MTAHDTVVRVDVDTTGVRTTEGIGVGDTEAKVLATYQGLSSISPSPYSSPNGHDIHVGLMNDSSHALIFQIYNGRVVAFRAGRHPEVGFIEGCS